MTKIVFVIVYLLVLPVGMLAQEQLPTAPPAQQAVDMPGIMDNIQEELQASVVRLPLAAVLGAILALRPKRAGTPERQPAVVQTQIILAVVGALIMLVVGASLARAFGIVGAANLIRYRSRIDDPKDAVVMLCALSVGLASGVGLYGLAAVGTVFITGCLWLIEGFEPQTRIFELQIKFGVKTHDLRPKIEEVLRRYKVKYELRTTAEDEVSYLATAPRALRTDRVSNALMELEPSGKGAIEWDEKSKDKVPK
ncbi:MAG: MgtC/SapB family protein [Acidobacteriota bacterium]|nr:MgtC/SapB family protein [Acidobacteriota bacterium]